MRRLVVSLIVVAVVVVAVQIVVQSVKEQNRAAEIARLKESTSIAAYEKLIADQNGGKPPGPVPNVDHQDAAQPTAFPEDAAESIAGYERLYKEVLEKWGGDYLPQEAYDILKKPTNSWTDEEWTRMVQIVNERQVLIRRLRALAGHGGPAYALDFSKGVAMELPHLARLRNGARLLRASAIVKAAEGNYSESIEDIIAGMQLGDALAQEPVLISQLVRMSMYGTMSDALQRSVHGGDLSPELVSRLLTHLDEADNRQAFAQSMTGERVMGLQTFSGIRTPDDLREIWREDPYFNRTTTLGQIAKRPLLLEFYSSPLGQPWLNMDADAYSDILSRAAAAAELPYYAARPELERIENDIDNLPWARGITRTLVPSLPRTCLAQARHEATIDLMQMGLLLEQYQGQHGSYPQSLDAIAPGLGGELPVEPYTGEPYHYEASDHGFLLYSVGDNLTDDGGVQHDPRRGDIIWRGEYER
jgi:hypothetical protein